MTAASTLVVAAVAVGVAITFVALCLAERRARTELGDRPAPARRLPVWPPAPARGPFGGHPAIEGWVPTPEAGTVPRADDRHAAGRQSSTHSSGGPHGRPAARRCRRNVDHRW